MIVQKFKGIIQDRFATMKKRETRWYSSYIEAYNAAKKLCQRTMKERGKIIIFSIGYYGVVIFQEIEK